MFYYIWQNKTPPHTEETTTGADVASNIPPTIPVASSVQSTENSTTQALPGAECITDNDLDLSHLLADRQASASVTSPK